jgi:hypothetical protein
MEFTSVAKINSLHWITSLREEEQGVTRRILEDLEPVCEREGLPFERYEPKSAQEFLDSLDRIEANARCGMLPLLHLDMHGSTDGGLLVAATGEEIGWDVIADRLRGINAATGNNLCVVSMACWSFHVVSQLDISRVVPFFVLLAPEHEIFAGDVEAKTRVFTKKCYSNPTF